MSLNPISATNLNYEDNAKNLIIDNDLATGNITFTSLKHSISPKVLGSLVAEEAAASNDTNPAIRVYMIDDEGNEVKTLLRRKKAFFIFCETGGSEGAQRVSTATDRATMVSEVLAYLNDLFTETQATTSTILEFGSADTLNAYRDETHTTVLFDNGKEHAVNAIKAVNIDGNIDVMDHTTTHTHFKGIRAENVSINGSLVGGSTDQVVDALNALFTVSALGAQSPAPVFPLLDATVANMNYFGNYQDPVGDPIFGATQSGQHQARGYSTETIDERGEYFLVRMQGRGQFGIGLLDSDQDTEMELASGNGHTGFRWSQWFYNYGSYLGPWTTYGSHSGLSYGIGWNGPTDKRLSSSPVQDDMTNGSEGLFKIGINLEGRVECWYYDAGRSNEFIRISRSTTVLPEGQYRLGLKIADVNIALMAAPERVATDPTAPALAYRYIESPDGSFSWPLFATAEEANWVDLQEGGAGTSHTHVYSDDPSDTTWYMPDTGSHMSEGTLSLDPSISYTEIVTEADVLHYPSNFGAQVLFVDEGDALNYQTQPADTTYISTMTGAPAGITMTADGRIVGTAPDVSGDNVANPSDSYNLQIHRTNEFGTSTGSLQIVVTNLTPPATLPGGFNQLAGDFTDNGDGTYTLNDSSVVSLDIDLAEGERLVIPAQWATDNVLPFLDHNQSESKAFIGIADLTPNWSNTPDLHSDFDAVVRWEKTGLSVTKHSMSVGDEIVAHHSTVTTSPLAGYWNYAIEWDGTQLHVIRCTHLADAQSVPLSGTGASNTFQVISDEPAAARSGDLPIVIATRAGGAMNITSAGLSIISAPEEPTAAITTDWDHALDFSGSSERAQQVTPSSSFNALRMRAYATSVGMPADLTKTSGSGTSCPWATSIVFKADGNNSNQHIWNSGEGAGNNDDNIYLRLDADGHLRFGWGRTGSLNECKIAHNIDTSEWHGVYIAHNGYRSNVPSPQNLADAFDIRMMSSADDFAALSDNLSVTTAGQVNGLGWTTTGGRMDRSVTGDFTIGGRGANRNFHGKIAAMVVSTLKQDQTMPSVAEAKLMITDPVQWIYDYKDNNTFRRAGSGSAVNWNSQSELNRATGVMCWLMGDTSVDSYSNMIRNYVHPSDQNYGKLNLLSMVSNDIQTVNIPGLSS